MKKIRKYYLLSLLAFIVICCSSNGDDSKLCILGPCGTITANETNITISIAKINTIISNVELVFAQEDVALTASGFDPENTLTYSCWEKIPSANILRVKFTLEGTSYDLELSNMVTSNLIMIEIIEIDNTISAEIKEYIECEDNPIVN